MKTMKRITFACQQVSRPDRRGAVLVLAAAMLLVVFGIAAFTVDFGILNVTKGQIQNAADSAALAATQDLINGLGPGATVTTQVAAANAGQTARDMVHEFRSGDVNLNESTPNPAGCPIWSSFPQSQYEGMGKSLGLNPIQHGGRLSGTNQGAACALLGSVFSKVLGFNSFDVEARSVASVAPAR